MGVHLIARSVHGIEWVAAEEISRVLPDARDISLSRREITFTLSRMDARLLELRTVDDVFLTVGELDGIGTTKAALPPLAAALGGLDWPSALAAIGSLRVLPRQPAFDVVASLEGKRSYNRFAVENTAGTTLAPLFSGRHLARTPEGRSSGDAELSVRLFLRGSTALAALRLGAAPLHRRAYKQDTGPGTLHPPMAAALVSLAGAIDGVLLDPFCGDGTIAIEAALTYPDLTVLGADIDPARLAGARRNAERAGVNLTLVRADGACPPWRRHSIGALVTNPPWGLSVAAGGRLDPALQRFWRSTPELLAANAPCCLILDTEVPVPAGAPLTPIAQVRLAGRISHILGYQRQPLTADLLTWRERAIAAGVVTEAGF